jgi:hypothetical protein
MIRYALSERHPGDGILPQGISCDESGVFIAGDVPLVVRSLEAGGGVLYRARTPRKLAALLELAYGTGIHFSAHIAGLERIARYMTEGKWVLAKIAAVQLRLPNVSNDLALKKVLAVGTSITKHCSCDRLKRRRQSSHHARKGDVSNEPRIPAGQSGGGEWTTDGGSEKPMSNPLVVPAQAIAPPMPMPWIDLLPDLPTEVTPLPLQIPNGEARELPKNPYPDRPDCAAQWAAAYELCNSKRKEFKKGYHGWGENMAKCLLGQVTADCGGNAT